jgi:hypothetical protein
MRSIGRGKRYHCPKLIHLELTAGSAMMSGVPELHTVITGMGDRIRQLELALSNARHPLDRHKPLDKMLSTLDRPPAKSIPPEVLGSLSVNAAGDTIYFGPTAGPEVC